MDRWPSRQSFYQNVLIEEQMPSLPVIGITVGDSAGVGPEVVKKALSYSRLPRGFEFAVIGSREKVIPGKSTARSAQIALEALEQAALYLKNGKWAAVVTGPVQKESLVKIGFRYPGQTEFFAAGCGAKSSDAVMLLTGKKLRVALCSTHCSLIKAIQSLTVSKVCHVAEQTYFFLKKLKIRNPKIAVAGINPHAGENGLFGNEEARILQPAVKLLKERKLNVTGPYSPDTLFYRAAQGEFDAVVCAYHDQGLIPFKLLEFTTGVNVTLGLPIIRTSPDHGTALDIAGKNKADPSSMIAAIELACKLVKSRRKG